MQILSHEKASFQHDDPKDVMSWLLKAQDETDHSAPPGDGAFQEDSRLMIIAGRLAHNKRPYIDSRTNTLPVILHPLLLQMRKSNDLRYVVCTNIHTECSI